MKESNRKVLIAGNWKMNKTVKETEDFVYELKNKVNNTKTEVLLCVPFLSLKKALDESQNSKIKIAAQNCHFKESGAFTGEVSVLMLKDLGIYNVLLGHSERRQYFNETDYNINLKLKAALKENFTAIVCVGETLEERKSNITNEIISIQIKNCLKDISSEDMKNVIIAYEPIWAIGTGETASKEQAQLVCKNIRGVLENLFDFETANNVLILYGGSVKKENIKELLEEKDIDGALIGGASLDVENFNDIIEIAEKI